MRRAGAHRVVSLAAPGVPQTFRPGTFVKVAEVRRPPCGSAASHGTWWIARVAPASAFGPTVEVVVDPTDASSAWLPELPVGAPVAVTGALGRPFSLPRQPVPTLLVGEGDAVPPLLALAERLRERSCPVTLVAGAADEQHLYAHREARRLVRHLHVRTLDGSVGDRGSVVDGLDALVAGIDAAVLYAAGSPQQCRPVAEAASRAGLPSQVALRLPLACGTGLCHGCSVPVAPQDDDGAGRRVRACTEGPVLPGDRVDWAALCASGETGVPGVGP